jgi:CDP-glucose 4,6-dehydratase
MAKKDFYRYFKNKKVLITGNSGFKGQWLSLFLNELGCEIYGLSMYEKGRKCFLNDNDIVHKQYECDIRKFDKVKQIFNEVQPDIIFHLAANAITLDSLKNPLETIETNTMGTANILECLRLYNKKCTAVIITSDKSYKNKEWIWGYRENDELGGKDPYSASKSMVELLVSSYYQSFFEQSDSIKIATCRAGNVIGGGDFAEMRIIPDCIKAWSENKAIEIRNPESTRPWSYVLDVLYGYLLTAFQLDNLDISGEAFNFGPNFEDEVNVLELVNKLWKYWDSPNFSPYNIIKTTTGDLEHRYLKLNNDKARRILKWNSQVKVEQSLKEVISWYKEYLIEPDEIDDFSKVLIKKYIKAVFNEN